MLEEFLKDALMDGKSDEERQKFDDWLADIRRRQAEAGGTTNICYFCGRPCAESEAYCEECAAYIEPCFVCGEWDHRDNMMRRVNEKGFVEWYHVDCFEPDEDFDGDQIEYSEPF